MEHFIGFPLHYMKWKDQTAKPLCLYAFCMPGSKKKSAPSNQYLLCFCNPKFSTWSSHSLGTTRVQGKVKVQNRILSRKSDPSLFHTKYKLFTTLTWKLWFNRGNLKSSWNSGRSAQPFYNITLPNTHHNICLTLKMYIFFRIKKKKIKNLSKKGSY